MPPDDPVSDVPESVRRWVLEMADRLATIDHYELLGIPRDADKKAIKQAYFRLVGVVHPDRYFGKRLGGDKQSLERVFDALTQAYETLSWPRKRAVYNATLARADDEAGHEGGAARRISSAPPQAPLPSAARAPAPAPQAPRTPAPAAPPAPPASTARREAMDALKQRFLDARSSAAQHAEAAERARAAGDFVAALEAYKAALRAAPGDPALKKAMGEVERLASARIADTRRKQALLEERYGHWKEAAVSWQRVLDARPDDRQAKERLEVALERSGTARR